MRAHTGSRIAVNSQSIPDATKSWILPDSPSLCVVPSRDSGKGQNGVRDELKGPPGTARMHRRASRNAVCQRILAVYQNAQFPLCLLEENEDRQCQPRP
jgi:hypothetical protein